MKPKKSSIFVELSKGLSSFVTVGPDASTSLIRESPKVLKLRQDAARIRSTVAKVRELKAKGMTREQALDRARELAQRPRHFGIFNAGSVNHQDFPSFAVGQGMGYYVPVRAPERKNEDADS